MIDELLTRYIEALVYQAVAENMASEQSARMVAMKAATDNAGNLIAELKLIYNKTRQAAITKELSRDRRRAPPRSDDDPKTSKECNSNGTRQDRSVHRRGGRRRVPAQRDAAASTTR